MLGLRNGHQLGKRRVSLSFHDHLKKRDFFRLRNGKKTRRDVSLTNSDAISVHKGGKQLSSVANMFLINFHRKSIMLFLFSRGWQAVLPCIHTDKYSVVQYNKALSFVKIKRSLSSASTHRHSGIQHLGPDWLLTFRLPGCFRHWHFFISVTE